MARVISASFADILLACQTQIVTVTGVNVAQVSIVAISTPKKWNGTKDCLLQPLGFISAQEAFDGAGRTATKFRRYLDVILRSRLFLDKAGSDQVHLTDDDYSHIRWEEAVAAALAGFMPVNTEENQIVTQPIRIFDGAQPQQVQNQKEWHESSVRFEVEYMFLLHQPEL